MPTILTKRWFQVAALGVVVGTGFFAYQLNEKTEDVTETGTEQAEVTPSVDIQTETVSTEAVNNDSTETVETINSTADINSIDPVVNKSEAKN